MKKLIALVLLITAVSAQAKDVCFVYDDGLDAHYTLYQIKAVKVKRGQAERLVGVAVRPYANDISPLTVEGSAIGLTLGHINYYLTAFGYDGKPVSEPVYARYANQPSYSGTYSDNFKQVRCEAPFPLILSNKSILRR